MAQRRTTLPRTLPATPDPGADPHGRVQPRVLFVPRVRLHLDLQPELVLGRFRRLACEPFPRGVAQALEDLFRPGAPPASLDLDKDAVVRAEEVPGRDVGGEGEGRVRGGHEMLRVLAAGAAGHQVPLLGFFETARQAIGSTHTISPWPQEPSKYPPVKLTQLNLSAADKGSQRDGRQRVNFERGKLDLLSSVSVHALSETADCFEVAA